MATVLRIGYGGNKPGGNHVSTVADFFAASARESWMKDALCTQVDPDLWFPESAHSRDTKHAIQLCNTECPVRAECLQYALDRRIRDGIWGGLTERQRRPYLAEEPA